METPEHVGGCAKRETRCSARPSNVSQSVEARHKDTMSKSMTASLVTQARMEALEEALEIVESLFARSPLETRDKPVDSIHNLALMEAAEAIRKRIRNEDT